MSGRVASAAYPQGRRQWHTPGCTPICTRACIGVVYMKGNADASFDRALNALIGVVDDLGGVLARLFLAAHGLELLRVRAIQVVEKRLVEFPRRRNLRWVASSGALALGSLFILICLTPYTHFFAHALASRQLCVSVVVVSGVPLNARGPMAGLVNLGGRVSSTSAGGSRQHTQSSAHGHSTTSANEQDTHRLALERLALERLVRLPHPASIGSKQVTMSSLERTVFAMLHSPWWEDRCTALKTLSPVELGYMNRAHTHHIVAKLNDRNYVVRCQAMKSLGNAFGKRLVPDDLLIKYCDEHVIPMLDYCVSDKLNNCEIRALEFQRSEMDGLEMLKYHDSYMRIQALGTLISMLSMHPNMLTRYVDKIIAKLGDREGFVRAEALTALNYTFYDENTVDEVTESRLDEITEKMIDDDHWKVKMNLLYLFLDLFEPENERMVKIKKMIGKYAERLVSKIHDKDPRVQSPAMAMMSFLEPHVLARCIALRQLEPQVLANLELGVLARVVEHTITELDNDSPIVRGEALRQLKELPLLALVPHRSALQCRSATDAVAPLRGRVWLVRWRQLFWGERLLWWWGGRARKPAQAQRRGEKRARS